MVKAVRVHQPGPPEALKIEDLEIGTPGEGEALVEIQAIGLNRAEAAFRQGQYIAPPSYPARIGYEAAGVLLATGPGVTGFTPGQRVSILPNFRQGAYGVYAEQAIVPASSLIAIPDWLGILDAAAVWMANFTAMAVIEVGKAAPGDFAIIPAASSSVGIAAIQLANWAGAETIAATRTSAKADALKALGARHVVATQETAVPAAVMRNTGGKGARIVFDPVGGPYVMTWASCMAERGILFQYGGLSGEPTPYPHWPAAMKGLSVRGWIATEIWGKPERFAHYKDLILHGLQGGRLKPVIARTFTLDEIVEAHRFLESNQQVGKIVVKV
ncbi:MAG: zinc-dependent alcohol dehydrogenase family protein [Caulobacteraceae bacterium]